jgi:hypothetical protein
MGVTAFLPQLSMAVEFLVVSTNVCQNLTNRRPTFGSNLVNRTRGVRGRIPEDTTWGRLFAR